MLLTIPEVTEQPTKGKPPVGACQLVIHRGSHPISEFFDRFNAVAFAYAQDTRPVHLGQRTPSNLTWVDEARGGSQ